MCENDSTYFISIFKLYRFKLHFCLSCSDKFGDAGITALCIINIENDLAHFDVFLMSCRILGRNIENVFLLEILEHINKKGFKYIYSTFRTIFSFFSN